jgi:hypothetical protein
MRLLGFIMVCLMTSSACVAVEEVYRIDNVVVTYDGIEQQYVQAIARVVAAARKVAAEQFGFDMPETIKMNATQDAKQPVRLFNDGQDRLYLNVQTARQLGKPSESGVFHIYGICHEIGHLAMYRVIHDHNWLTSAATEGWAHYVGSRIVDSVYVLEKKDLWPDGYNYLADGMARLKRQLTQSNPSSSVIGAGLWKELVDILGDKGIVAVFRAWSKADIDPTDPGAELRKTLLTCKEDPRLADWWNKAEPVFVFKRPRSGFIARTAKRNELTGQLLELSHDDGRQAGKRSIAGSGHVVRFTVPGDSWYLTSVQVYGSRYGYPAPPREDFHVWLCDSDFKVITDFPQPYSKFRRANPHWVNLPVEPTNVPSEFVICVAFNPTATKGVYVGHDKSASRNSFIGLAGQKDKPFDKGNWMIRVKLDQLKNSDALSPMQ